MNKNPPQPQVPLPPQHPLPGQPPQAAPPQVPHGGPPPQPPMGGPGGNPLLPQPHVPQAQRTYRAFYDDPVNDPYRGQYTAIMDEYRVPLDGLNVQQPQALAQRAYQSAAQGTPISFVILASASVIVAPNDIGRLFLLHRVAKFHAVVGMPPHQWDNRAFAFKGDLVQGQLPSVDFGSDYLHQIPGQQTVPTSDALTQLLAGDPALDMVGPFANGEAGTELIRTRRCIYVPPRYVTLFLETDLSPREGYERFLAAATANNDVVECAPLLQWLHLALMRTGDGLGSALVRAPPLVPLADAKLIHHRWSFVIQDLPVLDPAQVFEYCHTSY
jgi:hypothetical protein